MNHCDKHPILNSSRKLIVIITEVQHTRPTMTDVWVHNLSPFLLRISGNFGIRWYSLAYLSGFAIGFLFLSWMSKTKKSSLTLEESSDFLTYMILGVLLGGRIGYVFFYSPDLILDFRSSFPFWGGFAVWEGGMASHGGFIGVITACLIFAWRYKKNALHLGDLTIMGATLAIFLGRIANFINGELMGKVAEPGLAWAVKFPQDMYRWIGFETHRLTQLSDVVSQVGVSSSQWQTWVNQRAQGPLYATADKMIDAIQAGNSQLAQSLGVFLEPRHPSQLYAALAEGLIPFLILLFVWAKPRKPGIICSLYLIIYSFSRIIDEKFRLPDAHLSDLSQLPLGLSRGQFLSLFMFLFGVVLMIISLKRNSPKQGGLFSQ